LKILIVTQYFWPENFKVNDLAVELVKRGHEVTVYTGLPNYPQGKFFSGYGFFKGPFREEYEGVKVVRCPIVPRGEGRGIQLIINFLFFGFFGSFASLFQLKGKFDKIFVFEVSPIFCVLPAIIQKWIKKSPVFLWMTDLWPESLIATGVTKKEFLLFPIRIFVKFVYQNSDRILTSSIGFIPRITSYNISKSKVLFWPQWAENIFEENSVSNYSDSDFPDNKFVILFAGNIGSAQDMPTLLKTASLVNDSDIQFVVLGDGIKRKECENVAKQLGLTNIKFLGRKSLNTMPYYYKKADVLYLSLISSELFSITLPSKLQTYLASGKPILASMDGEGSELIKNWNCGKSVTSSSPEKLSQAIRELKNLSVSELKQMGSNSYHCYKELFDRSKLISELEEIFESVN